MSVAIEVRDSSLAGLSVAIQSPDRTTWFRRCERIQQVVQELRGHGGRAKDSLTHTQRVVSSTRPALEMIGPPQVRFQMTGCSEGMANDLTFDLCFSDLSHPIVRSVCWRAVRRPASGFMLSGSSLRRAIQRTCGGAVGAKQGRDRRRN